MTAPPGCAITAEGESPARYAAGTLASVAADDFEQHLLSCADCQRAVREATLIGSATRAGRPAPRHRRRPGRTAAWLAAAAAAAVMIWIARPDPLRRLGAVSLPPFAGLEVRSAGDSAVDAGMRAYVIGNYRDAARSLARAAETESAPPIDYYLGLSLLASGQPDSAVTVLTRASADPVYGPEAEFYIAKAWLQLGHSDSALSHAARTPRGMRLRDSILAIGNR